jgi:2-polyprenyl-6-methoxyphenol hydroxylase-like FAD-dependent oxidoreductase
MTIDIVIVGGGPNGLLTACELALAGVRPVVLERLPERSTMPKANGLVGRVVQALHYRGLYERFSQSPTPPYPVPGFQFGALPLNLSIVDNNPMYVLPIPQRRIEELLEQRAHELGVEIRRGHEVAELSQTGDAVTVDVHGPDGSYQLTTRYLVGADGGRSTVRKRCGIEFPGITDSTFVGRTGQVGILPPVAVPGTGELDVAGVGRLRPATFTRTDRGLFAYGMFQPGVYRVSVHEWAGEPVADSTDMPIEELQAAAGRVLGGEVPMAALPPGHEVVLTRTTESNSRLADRYRHGRVFLVGDAAHVHSGIGGPGLNLGMQDAINLAWKLAAEINGWAPDGLLDTYESERRPVGQRVIMSTRAQTALISPGPHITALRELLDELLRDPGTTAHVADLMAGAEITYGAWMPDLVLDNGNRVSTLLRAARPVLLNLAGREDVTKTAAAWSDRVDVITASSPEPPADAVLIRPDGYVAWAGAACAELEGALNTWFGKEAT